MKVIDLLNKIANGEELPKKIYCFDREFYLNAYTYFGDTFTLMHYIQEEDLNEKVEIIEEEKKIPEKLKLDLFTKNDVSYYVCEKINSIIDYLKSKGE